MQKPYIKKYGLVSEFTVYIVDGKYIRTNIEEEFTNFGQHYRFRFIPKNEFWIDKEYGSDRPEVHFYIDHLLKEYHLMEKGYHYNVALARADAKEQSERRRSLLAKHIHGPKKKLVYKIKIKKYSTILDVWIVCGELVRDLFYIDFTEGGHDLVYPFIPRNEIWLDDDIGPEERKFVLLHELRERNVMSHKMKLTRRGAHSVSNSQVYNLAHAEASELEYFYRRHPKGIDKALRKELKNCISF